MARLIRAHAAVSGRQVIYPMQGFTFACYPMSNVTLVVELTQAEYEYLHHHRDSMRSGLKGLLKTQANCRLDPDRRLHLKVDLPTSPDDVRRLGDLEPVHAAVAATMAALTVQLRVLLANSDST